ncbi:MAG TPA: hypothetical protein VMW77_06350 [Methanoregula sp.]|nr:hypothetical protein [Methanoregula sp.]
MNASNTDFEPASPLRVARSSLRNRCPERSQCAIPHERCCTPKIRQMKFGWGVPCPVVVRKGELMEKWRLSHDTDILVIPKVQPVNNSCIGPSDEN